MHISNMFMWNEKFDPMSFPEAIDKVLKRQFVFKIKVVPNCFCFFVMELCEDKELTALALKKIGGPQVIQVMKYCIYIYKV